MVWAQLSETLLGQENLILPLDILTVSSCSHWRLASGKMDMRPWARNVLALSEFPVVFLLFLVEVIGMAAHSVVMMVAGLRRSPGSTSKMAGGIAE